MSGPTRILLVDHVAMFRDLGKVFLSRSGPVDLAASAAQALTMAAERTPAVVIADMHLPDMDGPALCRAFKADPTHGLPRVVLLARAGSPADHAAAVRSGADEVLFKPLERETLITTVRRLTDFDSPRGLPRARIERPIEINARGLRITGRLRNVSRGGLFIDAPMRLRKTEEIGIQFSLDDAAPIVSPTAQVVWIQPSDDGPDGVGLRFLEIDPATIDRIEHFVSDHYPRSQSLPV
ncbi:response regulator [Myxococcota bacterium]|nr:response regulator [Myxococcota bacterium]